MFKLIENMDNWDEEKLKEVVDKKHSSANRNQTSIVVGSVGYNCNSI